MPWQSVLFARKHTCEAPFCTRVSSIFTLAINSKTISPRLLARLVPRIMSFACTSSTARKAMRSTTPHNVRACFASSTTSFVRRTWGLIGIIPDAAFFTDHTMEVP